MLLLWVSQVVSGLGTSALKGTKLLTELHQCLFYCPIGSGPRYLICVTHLAFCASQKTKGHSRIARYCVWFSKGHGFFDSLNVLTQNLIPLATVYCPTTTQQTSEGTLTPNPQGSSITCCSKTCSTCMSLYNRLLLLYSATNATKEKLTSANICSHVDVHICKF